MISLLASAPHDNSVHCERVHDQGCKVLVHNIAPFPSYAALCSEVHLVVAATVKIMSRAVYCRSECF